MTLASERSAALSPQQAARFAGGVRATAVALALLLGCGGSETPAKHANVQSGRPQQQDDLHGVRAMAEIGGLNEEKVEAVFKTSLSGLESCLNRGSQRIEFLAGAVSFFIKVGSDGKVEHAHLERSSLGDRETERCMLDSLRAKRWPKPVGGEHGLARKSFDFDAPADVRPPLEWDEEHVKKALKKLKDKIAECKSGNGGAFEATSYVSTEGSVLAVGVTPPDESGEASVDCLVETLRTASFPSPGSWPAKVTFAL